MGGLAECFGRLAWAELQLVRCGDDERGINRQLNRLLHYSTTVNIRGDSYRLKDIKRAGVFSMPTSTLVTPAPQVGI